MLALHFQETLGPVLLLLSQFTEVAHVLQSHIIVVSVEAQGEVGVGGRQVCVDQADDGGLHLNGIILTILGAYG